MASERSTAEHRRLADSRARRADWKQWGPYLSERAWGTVREDYSASGDAWEYFPHEHARSRTYRWNEDGLGGFCNRMQNLCLAVALWNGRDPFLKERLFGLGGHQGNHGEDVKEYYYYLDGLPSHAYMKMLYRYPQAEFPYAELVRESAKRGHDDPEYELFDALREAFVAHRYFDVTIEYAKAGPEEILCRITAENCGPDAATLHVLPHLWFRNTWSWTPGRKRPRLRVADSPAGAVCVSATDRHLGDRWWWVDDAAATPLFTENETNPRRVFGRDDGEGFFKDGIHEAVVEARAAAVRPDGTGSKVAAHVRRDVAPGEALVVRVRFADGRREHPFDDFDAVIEQRIHECDEFYDAIQHPALGEDERRVQRQAFAGLLWNKQFYHYGVELWLDGDPGNPPPPSERRRGRNAGWRHLYNLDVLSMPDTWEYPWYAAWDLAFHTLPLALIDPEWTQRQLVLLLREWYMHPNGQLPAYEWNFGDVNPPVHAWAAWRVYKICRNVTGRADTEFLERVFQKLLLNFTWWVNRKDTSGYNVFEGGFLGLDNIGVFDRSRPLPGGLRLEQSDSTAWMAMYCLNMMAIALELARSRPAYEDVATKFFEHFMYIANAINGDGGRPGLWDEKDGFYYDVLLAPDGRTLPLKIRSFVGLIPLFAAETLEPDLLQQLPHFRRRMEWFVRWRPHLLRGIASMTETGEGGRLLLALVNRNQLSRVLERVLDEQQFLAPHGLRSLSLEHREHPYTLKTREGAHTVSYDPGESTSGMFGGNSNWRGPVWFPVNYLMVEALQKFHHYYGPALKVDCPRGSGRPADLCQVADELSRRLIRLFLLDDGGRRPYLGDEAFFQHPRWRDRLLFHEYFHGDSGAGLGASHQTGWTALVAKLLQQQADRRARGACPSVAPPGG